MIGKKQSRLAADREAIYDRRHWRDGTVAMELARDLVRVEITRLPTTGMLLGVCPVLRGLFVHGRNVTEMEDRIPRAIRIILEERGYRDIEVKKLDDDGTDDASSVLTVRRYQLAFRLVTVVH